MTDDILFFCAKMMVGHDGLLSDMSVGRASLYQKIPSCPNFYLMWCTLKWNSPYKKTPVPQKHSPYRINRERSGL
jgi:hypothetical protein